jgi:hypothetical protein
MKWIRETFGEDKLKEIFDKAVDNFGNDSGDVSPEDAAADVLGLPWDTLLAMFHAWMMSGAITDNGERIKVNSNEPFTMDFETEPGSVWKITVIYVYADGSREQADNTPRTYAGSSAPWPVNPGAHDKVLVEIIVIKTLITTGKVSQINMTLTPVNPIGPQPLTPNVPEPFKLPPGFFNITDIHDFPWSKIFEFDYTVDSAEHTLDIILPPPQYSDSFFDIMIEIDDTITLNQTGIDAATANPYSIIWDSAGDWPFGRYNITIKQSTIESVIMGTVEMTSFYPDGWSFEQPRHHDYGELIPQDSNQFRSTGEQWFTYDPTNSSAFEYFLTVEPEFELTADWNMELFDCWGLRDW